MSLISRRKPPEQEALPIFPPDFFGTLKNISPGEEFGPHEDLFAAARSADFTLDNDSFSQSIDARLRRSTDPMLNRLIGKVSLETILTVGEQKVTLEQVATERIREELAGALTAIGDNLPQTYRTRTPTWLETRAMRDDTLYAWKEKIETRKKQIGSHEDEKRFIRSNAIGKIVDTSEAIINNPGALLATKIKGDELLPLADRRRVTLTAPGIERRRAVTSSRDERIRSHTSRQANETEDSSTDNKENRQPEKATEPCSTQTGLPRSIKRTFSWMGGEKAYEATIHKGVRQITVAEAYEQGIQKLMNKTDKKIRRGDKDVFLEMKAKIIECIATGTLPWEKNSPHKTVQTDKLTESFKGISIWYASDSSNGTAPRVYFTMQPSPDDSESSFDLIFIGDCFKTDQGKIFKQFTGQRHMSLRSAGVGPT